MYCNQGLKQIICVKLSQPTYDFDSCNSFDSFYTWTQLPDPMQILSKDPITHAH